MLCTVFSKLCYRLCNVSISIHPFLHYSSIPTFNQSSHHITHLHIHLHIQSFILTILLLFIFHQRSFTASPISYLFNHLDIDCLLICSLTSQIYLNSISLHIISYNLFTYSFIYWFTYIYALSIFFNSIINILYNFIYYSYTIQSID